MPREWYIVESFLKNVKISKMHYAAGNLEIDKTFCKLWFHTKKSKELIAERIGAVIIVRLCREDKDVIGKRQKQSMADYCSALIHNLSDLEDSGCLLVVEHPITDKDRAEAMLLSAVLQINLE